MAQTLRAITHLGGLPNSNLRSCIISSGKLHILILFRFQFLASYKLQNYKYYYTLLTLILSREKWSFFKKVIQKTKIEYRHLFIIGSARANIEADWGKVIVDFSQNVSFKIASKGVG